MTAEITPSPEAIKAAAREMFAIYEPLGNWEEASQAAKDGYMYRALRTLIVAAPFIAAQAKAEALREAADALELPGSTDVGYYSGYTDSGYNQAMSDAEEWLTDRASTIERKSE